MMVGSSSQLAWQDPLPLSIDYGKDSQPLLRQSPTVSSPTLFALLSGFLVGH